MTLTPESDIENAYCVFVAKYKMIDHSGPDKTKPVTVVRMKKVGDLLADIPSKVKMNCSFAEGVMSEDDIEFFLFSGDGDSIATNRSKGLRMLTNEELDRFQISISEKAYDQRD